MFIKSSASSFRLREIVAFDLLFCYDSDDRMIISTN